MFFARYLISLILSLRKKTRYCLHILSEKNFLQRYLIKNRLSRIISPELFSKISISLSQNWLSLGNVLARYLISLSIENRIVSRYLISLSLVLSLGRISLASPENNCLVLSLGKMFFARYLILSIENRIISYYLSNVLASYLIILSIENRICLVLSLGRMLALENLPSISPRYLISLHRKQNCLVIYLSEECFLQAISLVSLHRKQNCLVVSRKMFLQRYLIKCSCKDISLVSPDKKNCLVLSLGRMFLQDLISLSRKQNCLILSLGRMFLQDISLVSLQKTELSLVLSLGRMFLQRYLISLSIENIGELFLYYSRKNVLCKISHYSLHRKQNCLWE
ncbi:unnamed protein product [Acanthosepion pharaonis]|uniref:Uncharacterized protein n=1 Tax=Acanthosepion pharaonis TaxID=158019 RepID=A0A812BIJ1_ACAPH|nr:unnamed protein product [Sepia pharaonis]